MTRYGYARVSTVDQCLAAQQDALRRAGCTRIYTDQGASGVKAKRPGLDLVLAAVQSGDTLVVWRLDRLGRSLSHLIEVVRSLGERGVDFRTIVEDIDTTTPGGKLIFHLFGAVAEFERDLISARTKAGLAAAAARGRKGGRPVVVDDDKMRIIRLLRDRGAGQVEICKTLKISKNSYYRYLGMEAQTPPAVTTLLETP